MNEAFLARAMDRYGDAVYRLALCRLQNTADAEDIYQDTFLALFQQSGAESWEEERLKAWLLRVAVNACTDMGRRRRRTACVDIDELGSLAGEDSYGCIELWDAVNRLPEKYRVVFHLFYGESCKTEEIGRILNIPASTVRVRLNRARNTLRKELTAYERIS